MTRTRILSSLVSLFAVALLVTGLGVSFLGDPGGYKITPEVKPAPARQNQSGLGTRTLPPAVTPARLKLRPYDAKLVALGREVYVSQCASCHGVDLEGQPNWKERDASGRLPAPPHDDTGHTWHHPDGMLFAITKFGSARITGQPSNMPGYAGILRDGDIVAVLSFIKSTWPAEIRKRHDEVNNRKRAP